ncbi:MAG: hypothetical protein ACRDJG_08370 [Actinomycetota bacterium]
MPARAATALRRPSRASTAPRAPARPQRPRPGMQPGTNGRGPNDLIDVLEAEGVPATVLLDRFLSYLRPALEEVGDWEEVTGLMERTRWCGTSARRQRRAFLERRSLEDVVDLLVDEAASG